MALLRDLLTEARYRNRKKRRVLTNHTYYNRRKDRETAIRFEVSGSDSEIEAFLSAIGRISLDDSVSLAVE